MDEKLTIDPLSGNAIRSTDNGPKEGDLQASQSPEPLALGADGLPVGWEVPHGDS